mgnify:CR=1 FL=1
MKKQIVTKMVSAALIAGMTVGLAGCGNGEKGSSQSAADSRTKIESDLSLIHI